MTFTEIGPFLKLISSVKTGLNPCANSPTITAHGLTKLDVHDDLVPHCGMLYDAVSTVIRDRFIDKQ